MTMIIIMIIIIIVELLHANISTKCGDFALDAISSKLENLLNASSFSIKFSVTVLFVLLGNLNWLNSYARLQLCSKVNCTAKRRCDYNLLRLSPAPIWESWIHPIISQTANISSAAHRKHLIMTDLTLWLLYIIISIITFHRGTNWGYMKDGYEDYPSPDSSLDRRGTPRGPCPKAHG